MGTGLLGYALAGGVAGVGKGMVEEAKEKRERKLLELRQQFQTSERVEGERFSTGERVAGQEFKAGEARKTRDAKGSLKPPAGYRWDGSNLKAIPGGPADKPSEGKPPPPGYRWKGKDLEFITGGPADPAQSSEGMEAKAEETRRIRLQAEDQAEREADKKGGFWSTEADFPSTGGDRQTWIDKRVREIIAEIEGGGAPAPAATTTTPTVTPAAPKAAGRAGTAKPIKPPVYNTKEDVRAAFQRGDITREEAVKLLQVQFGGS